MHNPPLIIIVLFLSIPIYLLKILTLFNYYIYIERTFSEEDKSVFFFFQI